MLLENLVLLGLLESPELLYLPLELLELLGLLGLLESLELLYLHLVLLVNLEPLELPSLLVNPEPNSELLDSLELPELLENLGLLY